MAEIKLIATDLDGTIIGSASELPLYTDFRDRILDLKKRHNAIWVVCTGRPLRLFKAFFSPMQLMNIAPDYVIIRHAYIYKSTPIGFLPNYLWNIQIGHTIWVAQSRMRRLINEWHSMVCHFTSGVTTIKKGPERLLLKFDSEEAAATVVKLLTEKTDAFHHMQVFRHRMEVDIRAIPFTKGLALSELAQHLAINREQTLAIGNGYNDISMLDGKVAAMTGCPANSQPEVMQVVNRSGGHIATGAALTGVIETIDAHIDNKVSSSLPATWVDPSNQSPHHRLPQRNDQPRIVNIWLILIGIYTVLLVFASFNMIPFVGGYILKPFYFVMAILQKLLVKFGC